MKAMERGELLDSGIIQEANRRFFHPLGLALGTYPDGRLEIQDRRAEDPAGVLFDDSDPEAKRKAEAFLELMRVRHRGRWMELGFVIQPAGQLSK